MAADSRHRRLPQHRFPPCKIFRFFNRSQSRMCFTNDHTGPSGTVKLAKKEAVAKPTAASTKEKKPAAKVHLLAQTFVKNPG